MAFLTRTFVLSAGLLAGLCASTELRADSVEIEIVNQSTSQWTLKAPAQANTTVSIDNAGDLTSPQPTKVAGRKGGEPNTLYYDLPGGKKFRMHIDGSSSSNETDYQFFLGGSNRNYKMIRAHRNSPTKFDSIFNVNLVGIGYQKLLAAPMKTIDGEDPLVTLETGKITIKGDNYPLK